ncbi:MAG: tetratricopeptide repeat protein [Sphingomonadales bacterium]
MTKNILPAVFAGLLLTACGTTNDNWETVTVPPGNDTALAAFIDGKKQLARNLELTGKLVDARREWRYVAAADPKDEEARTRVAELTEVIDARKAEYLSEGDAALARGQTRQAQAAFLKILAIDPGDEDAVARLRRIDRTFALAGQSRKDTQAMSEYRATVAREQDTSEEFEAQVNVPLKKGDYRKVIDVSDQFLKRNPGNKSAAGYRKSAYLKLIDESRSKGRYRDALKYIDIVSEVADDDEKAVLGEKTLAVRLELAGALYSQGVAVMTTNLGKAVELLTESVSLDPDNWRYRQSLNQARKMQENLGKIGPKPKS